MRVVALALLLVLASVESSSAQVVFSTPSRGPKGEAGSAGATGAQGVQGVPGATGSTGPTGGVGATGAAGSAGSTGAQGAAGAQGIQGTTGATGPTGSTGATGSAGTNGTNGAAGATGATGATGAAGPDVFGTPTSRTLSLATAYLATTTTKPAMVTINLTSTANFSLVGGTTNTADILIGSTTGVATGTGTIMCKYGNSITGTIAVGLNMNSVAAYSCTLALPAGYYFAIRQTAGTVTITSAFDQAVG